MLLHEAFQPQIFTVIVDLNSVSFISGSFLMKSSMIFQKLRVIRSNQFRWDLCASLGPIEWDWCQRSKVPLPDDLKLSNIVDIQSNLTQEAMWFYAPNPCFPAYPVYSMPPTIIPKQFESFGEVGAGQSGEPTLKPQSSKAGHCEKLVLERGDLEGTGYGQGMKWWSEDEDRLLLQCRQQHKMSWEEVALRLPTRNAKMCHSRYKRIKTCPRIRWKEAENQKLLELVDEFGMDWERVALHFARRRARHIREHFYTSLRPDLQQEEWTIEDDLRLIEFINFHGKDWEGAEAVLTGKKAAQIKNRYYGKIKKLDDLKKGGQKDVSSPI